jgi:hypothetical protein
VIAAGFSGSATSERMQSLGDMPAAKYCQIWLRMEKANKQGVRGWVRREGHKRL